MEIDNFAPLGVESAVIVAAVLATWLLPAGCCPTQKQLSGLSADQIDGIVGIKPLHVVSGNTYRRGNVCPPENGDLHLVTDIHWLLMEVSHFSFWFHNDRPPSFVL